MDLEMISLLLMEVLEINHKDLEIIKMVLMEEIIMIMDIQMEDMVEINNNLINLQDSNHYHHLIKADSLIHNKEVEIQEDLVVIQVD
jgi:hypothetical protein